MSWKGWTLPQTSTGKAALVTPPPWHYSGDIIGIDFVASRDAIARFLPPGMTPLEPGRGSFVFADWRAASDDDPRVAADPARGQYHEAFLLLYAVLDGREVGRVAFMWVDSDLSLVRGLIQGFPKKLGEIHMTRAVEVGRGGARRAPGHRFAAHVSALGRRLATASVTLERAEPAGTLPECWRRPFVHTRLWPRVGAAEPAVYEFHQGVVEGVECGPVHSGPATLEFGASEFEELAELEILEVLEGQVYPFAFSLVGGESFPAPR